MLREKTEWSQIYWFDTDETKLPRILLIGDSIVAGHRDFLSKELHGQAVVGAYSTSRIAGNPVFLKELELALSDLPPDLICFNNGLHELSTNPEQYGQGLSATLAFLRERGFRKIVWRNSTPITVNGDPSQLEPVKNAIVLQRNRKAAEVMAQAGIPVIDLYTPMLNHPEYRANDGYHYLETGRQVQAELLKKALLPYLEEFIRE